MFLPRFFAPVLLGLGLLLAPQRGRAQAGGVPVTPSPTTQYVLLNGAVVQRQGSSAQTTPLARNIKLPNGTKVNVKSGIVELPTGKVTSLREGDYVKADGGIVFATPASAAQARGDNSVPETAKFDTYVQTGSVASERERLLGQKIELLNRKISLLSQGQPRLPDTGDVDRQIQALDARLAQAK